MELGGYYRDDPETAQKRVYYFDDPRPILSGNLSSRWLSNLLAALLFIVASTYIQFTYSANINLFASQKREFGQAILVTGACSGSSSITISPLTSFVNAAGTGAFKVSGLRVDGVPLACQGVKFSISAYGDTSTAQVALFNTNATVVEVNDYTDGTFGVDLSAGLTITTNSANSFTVNFTSPVALASSAYKFTIQSSKNETLGVQWTPFTIQNYSGNITSGAFGNGRYVFAGSGGADSLLTSTDGTNWIVTNVTIGLPFEAVTYGNGKFVLVTSDGEIVTTSDGVNYSIVQFPTTELFSVAYGNGKFVAVGGSVTSGSTIYTSSDGVNWTSTRSGSAVWNSAIFTRGSFYIAGRRNSTLLTSTNGTSWTVVQASLQVLDWQAIAETNGIFAISAINTVGNQYRSSDATSWTRSSAPGRTDMTIAAASGVFVGVGKENPALYTSPWIIYSSKDAQIWSERSSILGDQTVNVFYANREFYAVSDSGSFLVSR
jgi:hypothetical protein